MSLCNHWRRKLFLPHSAKALACHPPQDDNHSSHAFWVPAFADQGNIAMPPESSASPASGNDSGDFILKGAHDSAADVDLSEMIAAEHPDSRERTEVPTKTEPAAQQLSPKAGAKQASALERVKQQAPAAMSRAD